MKEVNRPVFDVLLQSTAGLVVVISYFFELFHHSFQPFSDDPILEFE